MKGQLYIDNQDVFIELGVATLQGNYGELVAFPSSKTPDSNDWTEEDGKEFDLSALNLDTKDITLDFGFLSEWKFNDLVAMLSDMAYHGKAFRQTKNFIENLFRKSIDGLRVLDKTYQMVLSA